MPTAHGVLHIIDTTSAKPRPLELKTTTGVLSVDGSASTQPVSGTFFQATQPVSATALPLPSGAATASKQASIVTAVDAVTAAVGGTLTTTSSVSKNYQVLSSAHSASAGDFSTSSHDVSNYRHLAIAGTHTGSNNIEVWISNDDSTYVKLGSVQMYPDASGSVSLLMDCAFKYYKLKYVDAGTANIAGYASN